MFYQISDSAVFTWWDGGQGINSFLLEQVQILDVVPRPIGKLRWRQSMRRMALIKSQAGPVSRRGACGAN